MASDPYGDEIAHQLAALEDDQANRIGRTRVALALTPVALMLMPAEGAGVIAYTVWGALSGAGLNASEQGISMGLGYQDHYDWRETVWAAAAGGLIGGGAKVAGDAIGSVVSRFARRGASEAAEAAAGYLHRPYIRKAVRAEVEARAPRTADGTPIDPNTRQPISGRPDLGHKRGREFWREKAKAEAEGLTQAEFNERMNNPDLYQLEDPISNRSHRYERPR